MKYQRYGPFISGGGPQLSATFFNRIEDFLVWLSDSIEPQGPDWDAFQPVGARVPIAWIHRKTGEVRNNPDYIERALPSEPEQYERPLIGYDLGEKAGKA